VVVRTGSVGAQKLGPFERWHTHAAHTHTERRRQIQNRHIRTQRVITAVWQLYSTTHTHAILEQRNRGGGAG
jgi:hypothetical protein